MEVLPLKTHDQHTLESIFKHPPAHNLGWDSIIGLLNHIGSVGEQHNGAFVVSIGTKRLTLLHPHGKDIGTPDIARLREFLSSVGITPTGASEPEGEEIEVHSSGSRLVVVIDHHSARLFRLGAAGSDRANPLVLSPHDPHGFLRHLVHKKEANYEGERVPEDVDFYERIAAALTSAQTILLIGHATGKSSAVAHLLDHLRKRHSDIARRVLDSISADLSHMTDGEILALARSRLCPPK